MRKVSLILIVLILIAIPIAAMLAWMSSRPSWQLTARNSPQGVIIEIYKSDANQPKYRTVLTGQTIDTEVDRVARSELPSQLGRTTFHDETLSPGRWTVVINDTEIDIMERALIVDGASEITPQDQTE